MFSHCPCKAKEDMGKDHFDYVLIKTLYCDNDSKELLRWQKQNLSFLDSRNLKDWIKTKSTF